MSWRVVSCVGVLFASSALAQRFQRTVANDDGATLLCVTWSKRTLTFTVDAAGSLKTPAETEFTALDAAFASWQAVSDTCSDFQFIRGPRVAGVKVGKGTEDLNALVFRETRCSDVVPQNNPCLSDGSCANQFHCWDHSDTTIGLTTATYSVRTGIVYDADVEFNAAPHADGPGFFFTTISAPPCQAGREAATCVATDVQNTATHEIGHMVGFDHVSDPNSTMAPTSDVGDLQKRIIDPGTADGFCKTYPRGQPPTPCDELAQSQRRIVARNTGTFGCSCDSSGAGVAWVAIASAVSLLRRRRQ